MEPTRKLIMLLADLGLSEYEAKVYLALITDGILTAKNVSNTTGIPYGKVYELINTLANKGFCVILPTKPMKCQAISPKKAIEKTREDADKKFATVERQVEITLEPLFRQAKEFTEPNSVFWIINGRSNIMKKIEELINSAKKHICFITTENGIKRAVIHKEELVNAQHRNIDIKLAGPLTDGNKEDVQSLLSFSPRNLPQTNSQFISIDGKESLIVEAIPDDDNISYGRDLGVWITNHAFTKLLEDALTAKFNRAKPHKNIGEQKNHQ